MGRRNLLAVTRYQIMEARSDVVATRNGTNADQTVPRGMASVPRARDDMTTAREALVVTTGMGAPDGVTNPSRSPSATRRL